MRNNSVITSRIIVRGNDIIIKVEARPSKKERYTRDSVYSHIIWSEQCRIFRRDERIDIEYNLVMSTSGDLSCRLEKLRVKWYRWWCMNADRRHPVLILIYLRMQDLYSSCGSKSGMLTWGLQKWWGYFVREEIRFPKLRSDFLKIYEALK